MFAAFKKLLYVDQKQQRATNAPPPPWKSDLGWQQGELHISNSG